MPEDIEPIRKFGKGGVVMVIMAKQPQAGETKTRLCPPLSPPQASALYQALLQDTIELGASMKGIDLAIAITPPESQPYFESISPAGTRLLPVECRDIGDCLTKAFSHLLQEGYKKVLALNADGPTLPPEYLLQAVEGLDDHDVVLGPSEDGGYYLIAMRKLHMEIFTGIPWSTSRVITCTLEKVKALGLGAMILPRWYDVDTGGDLERLRAELQILPPHRLKHTRRFFNR